MQFGEAQDCNFPQLVILEQTPPAQCEINGEDERHVHTVVKNTSFDMRFGFKQTDTNEQSAFNFNHVVFDGKLLYDTEELTEVEFITHKPFEMRRILQPDGNEIQMQFRIKVLSSHHENLCFILKIQALHPVTGEELHPSMTVFSHPIRVISKPERKKKPKKKAPPRRKKMEERMKDSISEIEQLQQNQISVIKSLSEWAITNGYTGKLPIAQTKTSTTTTLVPSPKISLNSSVPTSLPSPLFHSTDSITKKRNRSEFNWSVPPPPIVNQVEPAVLPPSHTSIGNDSSSSNNEFGDAMEIFFMLYNTLDVEERHDKLRKIIRSSSKQELDTIINFISILAKDAIPICSKNVGCSCAFCPYELQLQSVQLDEIAFPGDVAEDSFSFYPE